ncbi:MAG: hypothetical protein ACQGVC_20010 [Myxococcota bacterium]
MKLPYRLLFLILLSGLAAPALAALGDSPARAVTEENLAPYVSAEPDAPPVTAANLLENDRFWPFHVRPVVDWTPPGADAPLYKRPAVLVRVNADGTVRLDFGRHGKYELPIEATDVVERANQVRTGEIDKMAPNLVLTLGNKLLDTSRDDLVGNHFVGRDTTLDLFLCVFADPMSEEFPAVADTLRRFGGRTDLLIIVFPQTDAKDSAVRHRLRAIDWKVPFVLDRFTKAYKRSIAGAESALPHVMLLTPDGRVVTGGGADAELAARVDAALRALPLEGQTSQASADGS